MAPFDYLADGATDLPLPNADYQLEHNLLAQQGRVYLTGTQALVRVLLEQRRADQAQGLDTAGFVSGYRGSPLGAVDQQMWRNKDLLLQHAIEFLPAINEELGATAVMGSQMVEGDATRKVQGVIGMWYGKGPGVDRAADALKHGNAYGSSPHGGVLVVLGDDHGCVSSSMPHQSEQALISFGMPVLNPANIEEYLEFAPYGWAMSRATGAWVGFKAISETVEGAAVVQLPERRTYPMPASYVPPKDGLHYRWPNLPSLAIEQRMAQRLEAVQVFARANSIDRMVAAPAHARLGILAAGKAYLDLREALGSLGLLERLEELGIALYKPGLTYPLERSRLTAFARGLQSILVVEEKGPVMEQQLKNLMYNWPVAERPSVLGKSDLAGSPMLPELGELRPSRIVPALAAWLAPYVPHLTRFPLQEQLPGSCSAAPILRGSSVRRTPYFCSGCPHNTSTKVPEGSRAMAGIGCHFMASWMNRSTGHLTQMGGEGVNWVGASRFVSEKHVFQNLGDGTYFHSGILAIRQAIAAGATMTYKILYNDAVAMTGGQPVDGKVTVPQIVVQVLTEGAREVAVVTDDPALYAAVRLPPGVRLYERAELDAVQRALREKTGVTVLVYDQTCAAEKRRRRKKNRPDKDVYPDPQRRMVINPAVCEGCGDCGVQSNCLSIMPLETERGRKRRIEQSSCNKDYSCVQGFCPSFVSVEGGQLRKPVVAQLEIGDLGALAKLYPRQPARSLARPFELLVGGIGGTGVVTVGALITMAAHLEGKGASTLDFMGFAQKGGAVLSHIRLAATPQLLNQARIDAGRADALLACDLVVGAMEESLQVLWHGTTRIIANEFETPTAAFTGDPDASISKDSLLATLRGAAGEHNLELLDANAAAERYLGDAISANVILMGFAWQRGLVPVSEAALMRAMELNRVAVEANKKAFLVGRLLAADAAALRKLTHPGPQIVQFQRPRPLDQLIDWNAEELVRYQNAAYANRYRTALQAIAQRELDLDGQDSRKPLTRAMARTLFKLMAYKDEFEVARLHSAPEFHRQIAAQFDGGYKLAFHLAPPLLARKRNGVPAKMRFGAWVMPVFSVLARLKPLRGTLFDPFGYTSERRDERALRDSYLSVAQEFAETLNGDNRRVALSLAALPERVRGFGHVKAASLEKAESDRLALLAEYRGASRQLSA
jgi:indolepyruvate ferredoxin oxidoreductase